MSLKEILPPELQRLHDILIDYDPGVVSDSAMLTWNPLMIFTVTDGGVNATRGGEESEFLAEPLEESIPNWIAISSYSE